MYRNNMITLAQRNMEPDENETRTEAISSRQVGVDGTCGDDVAVEFLTSVRSCKTAETAPLRSSMNTQLLRFDATATVPSQAVASSCVLIEVSLVLHRDHVTHLSRRLKGEAIALTLDLYAPSHRRRRNNI